MENVNNTCKVGDSLIKLARFNVGLAARTDSRSEAVTWNQGFGSVTYYPADPGHLKTDPHINLKKKSKGEKGTMLKIIRVLEKHIVKTV